MIRWHENFSTGDISLLLMTVAIQLLLLWPALGLFYGGLSRRRDLPELSFQLLPLLSGMSIAWCLWAFSLAFAPGPGTVPYNDPNVPSLMYSLQTMREIGDAQKDETDSQGRGGVVGGNDYLNLNVHSPVTGTERPIFPSRRPFYQVPHFLFLALHMMLFVAAPIPLLLLMTDRINAVGRIVFAILWGTVVYCPLAHWIWGDGWLESRGVVDSSGALLHIGVGFSALACAFVLKPKQTGRSSEELVVEMNPIGNAVVNLGTAVYWGGTALVNSALTVHADGRAVAAFMNTHLAASSGAISALAVSWMLHGRSEKTTACLGAIIGIVSVSAGCTFILPQTALITGFATAIFCSVAGEMLQFRRSGNEPLVVFVLQGLAGSVGFCLVGVFATSSIAGRRWDKRLIEGAIEGNFRQIGLQVLGLGAAALLSLVGTFIVLTIVKFVFTVTGEEAAVVEPVCSLPPL